MKIISKALGVLGLACLLQAQIVVSVGAAQGSSRSFVLSQANVNSGGGHSTSSTFVLDGSLAQPAAIGEAASSSYLLQSGFWTSLSTRQVVRVEGTGSGHGRVTAAGIDCTIVAGVASGDCSEALNQDSSIELLAVPDAGNRFDSWSGCDSTATTSDPGDTCSSTVTTNRTLIAAFTLLGTVGDRIWRDVNGDGIQDLNEPGLDGVDVTITDDSGLNGSATAAGGGLYQFIDIPPGTYTVSIDELTLPAGVQPSFDADGITTPHAASFIVSDGDNLAGVDFGYQPFVDLNITIEDSTDPVPGGETLIYTIGVSNAGPSYASEVVVHDLLPAATTLVASNGCAEDPAGAPTCTLGSIPAGETVVYTLEVSIDPAPPASITNTVTVFSAEADLNFNDNSTSESTELDDLPMMLALLQAQPTTADGALSECETVNGYEIEALRAQFSEPAFDLLGDAMPGDVTNPAAWSLVFAGDDAQLSTTACGVPADDDVSVLLQGITYDSQALTADVVPAAPLAPGLYRLFACGTGPDAIIDLAGNPLDGDGDGIAGDDFVRGFRVDPQNRFADGHIDCDLGAWQTTDPEIVFSTDDRDGSADSGSIAVTNNSSSDPYGFFQCLPLNGEQTYRFELDLWLDTEAAAVDVGLICTFYDEVECEGAIEGPILYNVPSTPDGGTSWTPVMAHFQTPAGTVSGHCGARLLESTGQAFDARFDQIELIEGAPPFFEDGFESGDTSAWSGTTTP